MRPSGSWPRTSSVTLADISVEADLEVRSARTQEEVRAAPRLRWCVFCVEQGVAFEAERDERDAEAIHVLALEHGRLVGTCRLLATGDVARLGRMAVAADRREEGIGAALLRAADSAGREARARRIRLHAQLPARGVYARAGYTARGEPFVEEGIEHVTMEKDLA
jgi:predicted GNAT family N-acyltransferase